MNSKYEFYEVVIIKSEKHCLAEIAGKNGAVLGKAQNEKGKWSYSIHVFETGISWQVDESELVSTGNILTRDEFYDGSYIKILVDANTGKGIVGQ